MHVLRSLTPVSRMTIGLETRPLADLDGDGFVSCSDIGLSLPAWGSPGPTDLNDDGTTDGVDLGMMLSAWTG